MGNWWQTWAELIARKLAQAWLENRRPAQEGGPLGAGTNAPEPNTPDTACEPAPPIPARSGTEDTESIPAPDR
jgi:hypothetical protein